MENVESKLASSFVCSKCTQRGGYVERLAMSGTGISRLFEIQPYTYAFVSCNHCGYTAVYNLKVLEGVDDVGTILEVLFSD